MFKPVTVEITNSHDFAIESHPFTIGVPFAEGALFSQDHLKLDCNGEIKQFDVTPLASWPDGSVKWLLLDFQTSIKANERLPLTLQGADKTDKRLSELRQVVIRENDDEYSVDTGVACFTINKQNPGLFDQVTYGGNKLLSTVSSGIQLIDEAGKPADSTITAVNLSEPVNALRKKISISGFFYNEVCAHLAGFHLKLTFYAGLATVKGELTLLNPQAAEHPGGVWDLGDRGSFFFKALSIKMKLADNGASYQSSIRLSPETDWRQINNEQMMLEQNSSGGMNWQSQNHVNYKGELSVRFKGYRYFEQGVQQASGDRAVPLLHLASPAGGFTAHIVDFWQNFPKGIQLDRSTLSLNFFPLTSSGCYELQGGERKKHTFYLDVGNNKTTLERFISDLPVRIPPEYYADTKVIPWLPVASQASTIQNLINRGIQGENNFFEKRETIDEYGWRNFGEIFADHEGLEYKGDGKLISHYNNQYDPLYGFIKQYLITGDTQWYKLLSELAQHIVDIDIYHTVEDRDEYNGGLFWHTHHYLSAFTCTHRTFSGKHAADFIYGEIGGGPGAEHCYTAGLSCYYFMTGDETYKDAALQLVNWLSRIMEGTGTVIERVFQFKSKELPIIKRLFSGEMVQRYKYPFTRGTGNYINSLIDAYSLTGERHYLSNVEKVIHQSIHPLDDISLRNLEDTELSWSYLIYLQAVCKYLELKTSLQEVDQACLYAKDSLLHYADWMIENETPFLQNPEKLEYPNHTWTAQDLRKASIFYIASLYSDDEKTRYLEAAQYYVRFVEDTLKHEESRYYSRILILLMQNDIQPTSLDYDAARQLRSLPDSKPYYPAPLHSVAGILLRFFRDIVRRLFKLSFKKEKRWLSYRMK